MLIDYTALSSKNDIRLHVFSNQRLELRESIVLLLLFAQVQQKIYISRMTGFH
jgi:hypothetical protein